MRVRVASGLFRLWVVFSVLWFAGAGVYTFVAYRDATLPNLTKERMFDDLIPAYDDCWDSGFLPDQKVKTDRKTASVEVLADIAKCEREADRWLILRGGVLFALSIPIIIFVFGWAFVWAFRGFLPAQKS